MAVGVNSTNSGLAFTNYMKDISETLNNQSKGRLLCKKSKPWTGSHLEWRVHTSRNGGIGPIDDGGQFQIPSKEGFVTAKAYRRALSGKVQITDMAMAAIKDDKNAAKGVVAATLEGCMDSMLKLENGLFFRDGTGTIAHVVADYATTTLEVDDSRMIWESAQYDLYTTGDVFRSTLPAVTSIASAPDAVATDDAVVTLSANADANMVIGDHIKWKGATSSNSVTGLKALIDDTAATFQNVAVGTYPKYSALVLANGGTARELTPALFRSALAGLKQKCGNESPSDGITCLASNWDAISFEEMYEGDLRLAPSDKVMGLAVTTFQSALGKVRLVTDCDMLMGTIFLADFSQIYRGVQLPLDWRRDGKSGPIFKRNDESAVVTATMLEIYDHYIMDRNTSARIDDLSNARVTVY